MTEFTEFNAVTHPIVRLADDWNNLLDHGLEKGTSFIVRRNGTVYEAIDGATGKITYGGTANAGSVAGTDASAVINAALVTLTAGRTWKEKVVFKGDFAITTSIEVPSYTILDLSQSKLTLANNANTDLIHVPLDGTNNVQTDVDIIGGYLDQNGSNQTSGYVIKYNGWRGKVDGCTLKNGKDGGMIVEGGTNWAIENYFNNLNIMAYKSGAGFTFGDMATDNHLVMSKISEQSMALNGINVFSAGNSIDDNHIYSVFDGIYVSNKMHIGITNNYIEVINGRGVIIEATGAFTSYNIVISGNRFVDCAQVPANTYSDIELISAIAGNVKGIQITGNKFDGAFAKYCVYGANTNYIGIVGNNCQQSYATDAFSVAGANNIISNNTGYITENSGNGVIAAGGTSIVVNHGCNYTPSALDVSVILTNLPTNDIGDIYVDTFTATQFTIHCRNIPGISTAIFRWMVHRTP